MRIERLISGIFAPLVLLAGSCSGNTAGDSTLYIYLDYPFLYGNISTDVDLAVIAWEDTAEDENEGDAEPKWYCSTIPDDPRTLSIFNITWHQEYAACPLDFMPKILAVYPDYLVDSITIYVVTLDPTEEQVTYDEERFYTQRDTYIFLYESLGLDVPEYLYREGDM